MILRDHENWPRDDVSAPQMITPEAFSLCWCTMLSCSLMYSRSTHGAKHSPPARGPFGGSDGHLAEYLQNDPQMTLLWPVNSMMVQWIHKNHHGKIRRGIGRFLLLGCPLLWRYSLSKSLGAASHYEKSMFPESTLDHLGDV